MSVPEENIIFDPSSEVELSEWTILCDGSTLLGERFDRDECVAKLVDGDAPTTGGGFTYGNDLPVLEVAMLWYL